MFSVLLARSEFWSVFSEWRPKWTEKWMKRLLWEIITASTFGMPALFQILRYVLYRHLLNVHNPIQGWCYHDLPSCSWSQRLWIIRLNSNPQSAWFWAQTEDHYSQLLGTLCRLWSLIFTDLHRLCGTLSFTGPKLQGFISKHLRKTTKISFDPEVALNYPPRRERKLGN